MDCSDVPFNPEDFGMLSVAEARGRLAVTEPLAFITDWTGDPGVSVSYAKGWAEGAMLDPAPAWFTLSSGRVIQLTRQAARQLGSTARVNQKYQEFLPPEMLSGNVTWALQEGLGERELKFLLAGTGEGPDGSEVPLARAQTRATVVPFSNLRLLDIVLLSVRAQFGHDVADGALVDYKFFHDLEHTSFRVVFPAVQQLIGGTLLEDDAWCAGIEASNSLIGLKQTTVGGYLFRLGSSGAVPDTEHSVGGFNRRGASPDDVYAWAAEAVEEALGGVEEAFAGLRELAAKPAGSDYGPVLAQLFREGPTVAKELQFRVLAGLEGGPGDYTMFDLAAAVAEAANLEGSTWQNVRTLHDLAGYILHQGGGMCDGSLKGGCRRLLPEGWTDPGAS